MERREKEKKFNLFALWFVKLIDAMEREGQDIYLALKEKILNML